MSDFDYLYQASELAGGRSEFTWIYPFTATNGISYMAAANQYMLNVIRQPEISLSVELPNQREQRDQKLLEDILLMIRDTKISDNRMSIHVEAELLINVIETLVLPDSHAITFACDENGKVYLEQAESGAAYEIGTYTLHGTVTEPFYRYCDALLLRRTIHPAYDNWVIHIERNNYKPIFVKSMGENARYSSLLMPQNDYYYHKEN